MDQKKRDETRAAHAELSEAIRQAEHYIANVSGLQGYIRYANRTHVLEWDRTVRDESFRLYLRRLQDGQGDGVPVSGSASLECKTRAVAMIPGLIENIDVEMEGEWALTGDARRHANQVFKLFADREGIKEIPRPRRHRQGDRREPAARPSEEGYSSTYVDLLEWDSRHLRDLLERAQTNMPDTMLRNQIREALELTPAMRQSVEAGIDDAREGRIAEPPDLSDADEREGD